MSTRQSLIETMARIQAQIQTIEDEAEQRGVNPYLLKDERGNYLMAGPLTALLNAEAALAGLPQ